MRATLLTFLSITLLLSLDACYGGGNRSSSNSSGGGGGGGGGGSGPACLYGKIWSLVWVSSNGGSQSSGFWEFKTDGTYDWQLTKPTEEGGTGKYSYAGNTLTVDGFLKTKLVRSGKISLRFEGNQASFVDDNSAIWVYSPPIDCFLTMQQGVQVKPGKWRFDLLADDSADTSEMLMTGELTQDRDLIQVAGEPPLQGVLDSDHNWQVTVGPEFTFQGNFTGHPARRFIGTYVMNGKTGQILGYATR